MNALPEYEIPWDVIAASLQHQLSAEEAVQLQQWLSASEGNQKKYDQLEQLWDKQLGDFPAYQAADAKNAWEALQQKLAADLSVGKETPVIAGRFTWLSGMRRWAAVAAIFIVIAAGTIWYISQDSKTLLYETAANEQRNITLPDGSTIVLKQLSQVIVAQHYNKQSRTVSLVKGEGFFTVIHQPGAPFIVNMDESSVKDIGTSFTIQRTPDKVKVVVSSGKVAFIRNETNESKELSAGMALSFDVAAKSFGEVESASPLPSDNNLLYFDHTPLTDVVSIVQKKYNRKMELADPAIGQKKLKADLHGQTFDRVLQVICTSLNLDYTEKNGIIILREKENK